MFESGWKRLLSGLLALVLVIGMLPPVTVAAEETVTEPAEVSETVSATAEPEENEAVETTAPATVPAVTEAEETEPVETTEATVETIPETTEETVPETTDTTEETVAETTEATLPENVQAVQALIDALPTVDTVTAEDYDAVQDAYDAYDGLTEEEKALIQGADVFEGLFAWFSEQMATLATIASGTCGDNLTWTLDEEGTLTISGTGDMTDYSYESTPWYSNRSSITSAVIEKGVTSIGNYAFYDCTSLTGITIPEGVTSIGKGAFSYCSSLTTITIPKGVTSLGENAFNRCRSLTTITIPEGVTSIGEDAFKYCSSLAAITIPESVTSIGDNAFYECSNLASVTISEGVTSIGNSAFWLCDSLTNITIPGSVISIGPRAFVGCSSLTSVTILDGVTTIYSTAFQSCSSLTSIAIPDSVTTIGDYAFEGCSSLTSIAIPKGVSTIKIYTFDVCRSLTSVIIPDSVTSIEGAAFRQCTSLTDVYYSGTQEQWETITIGASNESLTNAKIHVDTLFAGLGTAEAPYLILTADDLAALATFVAEGNHCQGAYFELGADISLTGDWTPIGTASTCFQGHFDGNGHTISGISGTGSYLGLFGYVGSGAQISNVNISDIQLTGGPCLAGIAARIDAGTGTVTIRNCHTLSGTFKGDDNDYNPDYIAGIVGYGTGGVTIAGCTNAAYINSDDNSNSTGGIAGYLSDATVRSCINYGQVSGNAYSEDNGSTYLAGICGNASGSVFQGCANYGTIYTFFAAGISNGYDNAFYSCLNAGKLVHSSDGWGYEIGNTRSNNTKIENCYYSNVNLRSGEAAYLLRDYFGQNIGVDDRPVLLTATNRVYRVTVIGAVKGTYYVTRNHAVSIDTDVPHVTYYNGDDVFGMDTPVLQDLTLRAVQGAHTPVKTEAKEKTCTENGNYAYWTCSECGRVYADEACKVETTVVAQIIAASHCEVTDAAVAPTCTATGLTEGKHCSVCNEVLVAQETVAATGHTEVTDEAVAPTCTATGLTEGKHCSDCEAVLVAQDTIPATGHTEVTDAAVAPTCTETGLTEGKHCSVCNEVLVAQETVAANGHSYADTVTAPTCTDQGYTTHTCSVCSDSYVDTYVDALDHELTLVEAVAPTYFADGRNAYYVCGRCEKAYKDADATQETTAEAEILTKLESVAIGTCGENLSWAFTEEGVLIITGSGDMENFASGSEAPWSAYSDAIVAVTLETGITSIGRNAFCGSPCLSCVAIPESVHSIGIGAFLDCPELTVVQVPGTLYELDEGIFDAGVKITYTPTTALKLLLVKQTTKNAVHLTWNEVAGADGYYVYRKTADADDYTLVKSVSGTETDNYSLTPGTTYCYKIRAYTREGGTVIKGAESNEVTITIARLSTPELSYVSQLSESTAEISWSKVNGAEGYEIYRASTRNGEYTYLQTADGTKAVDTDLLGGTAYYYMVKAYCTVDGERAYSAWSDAYKFVMSEKFIGKPGNLRARMTAPGTVYLRWNAVSGAEGYDLYRKTGNGRYALIKSVTGCETYNYNLTIGNTYSYRVCAYFYDEGEKVCGKQCDGVTVEILNVGTPYIKSVTHTAAGTALVKWSSVGSADGYELYRSRTENGTYSLMKTVTGIETSNYNLTIGVTYYYKVRAYVENENGDREYGAYSEACPITIGQIPQTRIKSVTQADGTSAKVIWASASNAEGYEVWRSIGDNSHYELVRNTGGTAIQDRGLSKETTYYYKVRGYKADGEEMVYGDFSGELSVKLLATPNISLSEQVSEGTVAVTWSAVSGADGYEIWSSTSASGSYKLAKAVTTTTTQVDELTEGTGYFFKVRAYYMRGTVKMYGPFSKSTCVTVLGVPEITKISQNGANAVNITWNPIAAAEGYELYRSTSEMDSGEKIKNVTGTTTGNYSLEEGGSYYYKLRGYVTVNGKKQYGPYSASVGITLLGTPAITSVEQVDDDSVSITWDAVEGATSYKLYRSTNPYSGFSLVKTVTGTTTKNYSLTSETTYYYKIKAVRAEDGYSCESAYSKTVKVLVASM